MNEFVFAEYFQRGYVKPHPLPETPLSYLGDRLTFGEQISVAGQEFPAF